MYVQTKVLEGSLDDKCIGCTSAVSGAPCTMDGTDTRPRPDVPSLSTENLSPIDGSDSDTCKCELHSAHTFTPGD